MPRQITEGVPFQLHQLYSGGQLSKQVGEIWPALDILVGRCFVGTITDMPEGDVEVASKKSLYIVTKANGIVDLNTGIVYNSKFDVCLIEGLLRPDQLWARFILDKFRHPSDIIISYTQEEGFKVQ